MNLEEKTERLRQRELYRKANRKWYVKWWGILILLVLYIIASTALAFLFIFLQIKHKEGFAERFLSSIEINININEDFDVEEYERNMRIVEGSGVNYLGKEDSGVVLVLFSDFNCSYCKSTAEVVASLNGRYGDKIKIIVRDFPVLNDDSIYLSIAALCAGDQNMYWQMYYKLFELQGQFEVSDLSYVARLAGILDIDKFSTCLNSEKNYNIIVNNRNNGEVLGIKGTPTWFLNGEKLQEGFVPFHLFSNFFDKYLADDN